MSSRDLSAVVKTQKEIINNLLDRLVNLQAEECIKNVSFIKPKVILIQGKKYSLSELVNLLNDSYFKGLTLEQILELAKKSIRLTEENCKLRSALEDD